MLSACNLGAMADLDGISIRETVMLRLHWVVWHYHVRGHSALSRATPETAR
jgi:hypothetical protein